MFKINSKFKPSGDQPQAIDKLTKGIKDNKKYQTLLGVTGSGKTFTMANIIEQVQKPTLVIAHNKTLAAQLCNEFREFFPNNVVEYFVSYYDYYQPEAYMPRSDTYIEKEAQINDEIDRLRHATTGALLSRKDVIIVASVSCIYGLGSPESYKEEVLHIEKNTTIDRTKLMRKLIELHFTRTNSSLKRGQLRSRGNVIEINPIDIEIVYRIELRKNKIINIVSINPLTRRIEKELEDFWIFPARHFITSGPEKQRAEKAIKKELKERLSYFKKEGLLLEAERLERRTNFDLEMIREIGYCNGIENYSRHLTGRKAGDPAYTLLSYFPEDFLTFIDESHVTVPQIGGMYNGDKARKDSLIKYGFRLPSAYDNRPLKFYEFEKKIKQCIFTTATPSKYELENSSQVVEQIIRPTGLLDPEIIIKPVTGKNGTLSQVEDLIEEVKIRAKKKERVLVTTLTKKMAEDLSEYLTEQNVKSKYLHSDIKTFDRIKILTQFRKGEFDCLVGINLLREGLDLPEVTLVAILDADKEGFLRSETSLIQTIGRAARNVKGQVILYADNITGSLNRAIKKTKRRRKKQMEYNKKNNITPRTIKKKIKDIIGDLNLEKVEKILDTELKAEPHKKDQIIKQKEREMAKAAKNLEFELAALLRDQIKILKK
jgi:excinuclease ABC subunit B